MKASGVILLATLLFSALPTIRNTAVFRTPTSSSWLGVVRRHGFFAVRSPQRWYFRIALALILYFELVTHALNGGEQARMRYTIDVAYFVTLVFTGSRLAHMLTFRRRRAV